MRCRSLVVIQQSDAYGSGVRAIEIENSHSAIPMCDIQCVHSAHHSKQRTASGRDTWQTEIY